MTMYKNKTVGQILMRTERRTKDGRSGKTVQESGRDILRISPVISAFDLAMGII